MHQTCATLICGQYSSEHMNKMFCVVCRSDSEMQLPDGVGVTLHLVEMMKISIMGNENEL